jgi:predicted nucleic acid-binding protein
MLYLDTSFVAPIILPEATSDRIEDFVRRQPPGEMAVSHWTRIEFAGLVARRVRMRELRDEHAAQAIIVFNRLLADSFQIIMPALSDFDLAIELLNLHNSGLRSGDALHLAIVRNQGAQFITLDKKLIRAARLIGIPADSGIKLKSG